MNLSQRDSLDTLRLVALDPPPPRVPSPTSPHSSLSKPALVRTDLASLEKFITSHFNSLLGLPLLGCPISRWKDLPRVLANIQQYIDGVPPACIPIVDENDHIINDIRTWNEEQHSAMHHALNGFTIRACPRPVDRKVIFTSKVRDPSSGHLKLVESSCGYSPMWLLENMFTEQCYAPQTIDVLRQKQVPQFEALIGHLNSQKTIPWRRLPLILWNAGMIVTGMPRVCAPKPLDKHRSDGLKGLWPRAWRVWLQRVLDSGVLRVEPCPPDRQVVIRILEENYSLTDDHYGLASNSLRKLKAPEPPCSVPAPLSTVLEPPIGPAPIAAVPVPFTAPSPLVPTEDITTKFTTLLKRAGIIFGDPITRSPSPSWKRLPEMLAAKRMVLLGYPAVCLPEIQEDRVIGSYKPKHWNTQARGVMMAALVNGSLRIGKMPRGSGVTPMYFVTLDGYLQGTTLGYSREWVESRLFENPPDINDPKGFVIEQWISLLENDFPVYDVHGERSIPWTTLPLWLARRRQYIDGCPEDCLPTIEDDRVTESSSPYNYTLAQIDAIIRAIVNGEISLRMRPDEDAMLFRTKDDQGRYTHHTLGFSQKWINENMKSVTNRVEPHQPIQLNALPVKPGSPLILHAQTLEGVSITELKLSTNLLVVNVPPFPTDSLPQSPSVRLHPTPTQSVSSNNDTHSGSSRTSSHGSVVPIVGASGVKFVIPPARQKAYEKIESDHLSHRPLSRSIGFYPTTLPYPTPPLIATQTGTPPPAIVPYPFPGYIPPFHPALTTHSVPTFPPGFITNVKKPKARMRAKVKQQIKGKGVHKGRRISSPSARISSVLAPRPAQANNVEFEPLRPNRVYEVDFEGGEPEPGTFGLRDSLSPQPPDIDLLLQYGMESLPRRATEASHGMVLDEDMEGVEPARTRDELPVPIPAHLPKPGGELYYHVEAQTWEVTMGGAADEAAWGKGLPVFPCRVIWNATRGIWRCVPCERWEMITAEERVRTERDKRIVPIKRGWQNQDVPFVLDGLALVWQRSRRKWTLEEYVEEEGEKRFLREDGLG